MHLAETWQCFFPPDAPPNGGVPFGLNLFFKHQRKRGPKTTNRGYSPKFEQLRLNRPRIKPQGPDKLAAVPLVFLQHYQRDTLKRQPHDAEKASAFHLEDLMIGSSALSTHSQSSTDTSPGPGQSHKF